MSLLDIMQEIDTFTLEGLERNLERVQEDIDNPEMQGDGNFEWIEERKVELHYTTKVIDHKRAKLKAMYNR